MANGLFHQKLEVAIVNAPGQQGLERGAAPSIGCALVFDLNPAAPRPGRRHADTHRESPAENPGLEPQARGWTPAAHLFYPVPRDALPVGMKNANLITITHVLNDIAIGGITYEIEDGGAVSADG